VILTRRRRPRAQGVPELGSFRNADSGMSACARSPNVGGVVQIPHVTDDCSARKRAESSAEIATHRRGIAGTSVANRGRPWRHRQPSHYCIASKL
jgi:hypothetical protein